MMHSYHRIACASDKSLLGYAYIPYGLTYGLPLSAQYLDLTQLNNDLLGCLIEITNFMIIY